MKKRKKGKEEEGRKKEKIKLEGRTKVEEE